MGGALQLQKGFTPEGKRVGDGALNLIAINTVIPFLYAYGLHKADDVLCDRATRFLESLKAETIT